MTHHDNSFPYVQITFACRADLSYIHYMKIVWDEPKRQQNIVKHGLDFADLTFEFFLSARVGPAKEGRFIAVGELNGQIIVAVVFKPLGSEALSIISMRPAARKERNPQ